MFRSVIVDAEDFDTLLVFGGVYSNFQALEALLVVADRLDLQPQQIICTGDTAAYCGDPRAVLETVRDACIWHIKGNCEESLAKGHDDCGCGFAEGSLCSMLSRAWFRYADQEMTPSLRSWMASLPDGLIVRFAGRCLAVTHGTPQSINRFVFRSTSASEKIEALDGSRADAIIGGHCGLPFTHVLGQRVWHNSGALGMPANDGTSRTWYSILRRTRDGVLVEHHPLTYDYRLAAQRMHEAGLPEGYASALITGHWPSLDVLPETERRATGIAIWPAQHLWPAVSASRPVQEDSGAILRSA